MKCMGIQCVLAATKPRLLIMGALRQNSKMLTANADGPAAFLSTARVLRHNAGEGHSVMLEKEMSGIFFFFFWAAQDTPMQPPPRGGTPFSERGQCSEHQLELFFGPPCQDALF